MLDMVCCLPVCCPLSSRSCDNLFTGGCGTLDARGAALYNPWRVAEEAVVDLFSLIYPNEVIRCSETVRTVLPTSN